MVEKYFLIGEDIPKTEISEEDAAWHSWEDDYRVVSSGKAKMAEAEEPSADPDWEPFIFPELPGKVLVGYTVYREDIAGEFTPVVVDSVPEGAEKLPTPNHWVVWDTRGYTGSKYIAYPVYTTAAQTASDASGACAGCKRTACPRRKLGEKCRNYRG